MPTIPSVAHDATKTVILKKTTLTLTPSGGSAVHLIGKLANYEQTMELVTREIPDSSGVLRPDRIVPKKHDQKIKFEVEDIKTLDAAFPGNGIQGGLGKGAAELFVVDPDDASGKAAINTGSFSAVWHLDGGINFSHGEVAKATIVVIPLEEMKLQVDVTLTT